MTDFSLKVLRNLALWEWSPTSASNFPCIRSVYKLLEVWVFEVLTEARLLFLDLGAAELRWWCWTGYCTHTGTQLCWATCHCHWDLCLGYKHHKKNTHCNVWGFHFQTLKNVLSSQREREREILGRKRFFWDELCILVCFPSQFIEGKGNCFIFYFIFLMEIFI